MIMRSPEAWIFIKLSKQRSIQRFSVPESLVIKSKFLFRNILIIYLPHDSVHHFVCGRADSCLPLRISGVNMTNNWQRIRIGSEFFYRNSKWPRQIVSPLLTH